MEMLSRGAKSCLFVENDKSALERLKENLKNLELRAASAGVVKPNYTVLSQDLERLPFRWPKDFQGVDIFWADPPYGMVTRWLDGVLKRNEAFPNINGVLALELRSSDSILVEKLIQDSPKFRLKNSKKYGETMIMFLEGLNPLTGEEE